MKDDMGDRMKALEVMEAGRRLMPLLPVCVRLDGKSFHSYTADMCRPYDTGMMGVMDIVTQWLVEETGACVGYTQSDEISLVYYSDDYGSQIFFDGKIAKMTSVLAAMCSVKFYQLSAMVFPQKARCLPVFDCRVWNVPTKMEAANTLLWREFDATKNAISTAARHYYSHKDVDGKNGSEKQELLHLKGVNFNDYPPRFKRGVYFQRRLIERAFTTDEIDKLPPKHDARRNPNLKVVRNDVVRLEMPPFSKVLNRVEVIFDGADPVMAEE